MEEAIDPWFDVYSDTPRGRDPDSYSPTLRRYHRLLWTKTLPDGQDFHLTADPGKAYLHCRLETGDLCLSSDSIGHTYRHVKAMAPIVSRLPESEVDKFFRICSTIGAYIVFPSHRVNGMATINGARGLNHKIRDRFDLTLECIKRHYIDEDSPLTAVLARYSDFFALFGSFEGYVNFFLLQDLLVDGDATIRFFIPFEGFENPALPKSMEEYLEYKDQVIAFVSARNKRIASMFAQ